MMPRGAHTGSSALLRAVLACGALALVALLASAPAARAATVSMVDGELAYVADAGQANHVTVAYRPAAAGRPERYVVLVAPGEALSAGGGCTVDPAGGIASCPAAAPARRLAVSLGDGDDAFTGPRDQGPFTAIPIVADGGPGADRLLVQPGATGAALTGGEGDDTLSGAGGDDRINGGPGDDDVFAGAGADLVRGGDGFDTLAYERIPDTPATQPLTVSLDDVPGDGLAGENDDIGSDVERVSGGPAGDRLSGSAAADRLTGGGAGDRLSGGAGDDVLLGDALRAGAAGTAGDDTLEGGPGSDILAGGPGSDTLDGGPGADRILALATGEAPLLAMLEPGRRLAAPPTQAERNAVRAGAGDDVVTAAPGDPRLRAGDRIDCGPGHDILMSWPPAVPPAGCELVCVSPRWCQPMLRTTPGAVLRRRKVALTLRCPRETAGGCRGRLRLAAVRSAGAARARGRLPVGRASFGLRAGATRTVLVPLRRPTHRRLVTRRGLRALEVVLVALGPDGRARTVPGQVVRLRR
jgi:Ca2+-binding RTX toxin-like protein